jgi:hypothetical protein
VRSAEFPAASLKTVVGLAISLRVSAVRSFRGVTARGPIEAITAGCARSLVIAEQHRYDRVPIVRSSPLLIVVAIMFASGCRDSGSGQAGPVKTVPGQSTIEPEKSVEKEPPSPPLPR